MTSSPKETTTKVEPWDGAKQYLTQSYDQFDKLLQAGAPKAFEGQTYSDQSQATKDALAQAENVARNGNTSVLNNANSAVNNVLNQNGNTQANQTLSQLQNGVSLGYNPTNGIASQISQGTPSAGQSFTNGAAGNANALQGYNNSAINSIASMANYLNPAMSGAANLQNYTNGAVGQAANLNGYTNAASGLQSAQANQLAGSNNPALAYLQGTASGANIGKNSYLDSMVSNQQDKIAEKLKNVTNPGIDSQAAAIGRMGSGAYAAQRNNADSAAANEMAKVATDLYANQYNTDVQNQINSASQYGQFANQDVANRMNANQALSQTDQAQQNARINGTQLFGALSDSQNAARLSANQNYGNLANSQQTQQLNAANALGQFNDSQNAARLSANQNYASILDNQQTQRQNALNNDRSYQLAGMSQLGTNYQNNIANMLSNDQSRMNAATAQMSGQNALNGQQLQAANMASSIYGNQYLPSQNLAGVGSSQDAYNDLVLQSNINSWDRQQAQPLQNIANFVNLLNGGNYSNTTTPVYTNTGAQVLGGLSSLAGLFALCDIREKIVHGFLGVMPLLNGETIGIYSFSYKDDETQEMFVGPIAQEVEDKTANTVVEFNGRKVINVANLIKEAA